MIKSYLLHEYLKIRHLTGSLSKDSDILTLNFSYEAFFSHILFVNAIYTSLNPPICCRTSQPKCVLASRIFWLHSKSKNIKQEELFKQQESGTGRFLEDNAISSYLLPGLTMPSYLCLFFLFLNLLTYSDTQTRVTFRIKSN